MLLFVDWSGLGKLQCLSVCMYSRLQVLVEQSTLYNMPCVLRNALEWSRFRSVHRTWCDTKNMLLQLISLWGFRPVLLHAVNV